MSRCACVCRCRLDAASARLCFACAANRRAGVSCVKVARQSPEEAAHALSLAVRKVARNEYLVPSTSEPGTFHRVTLGPEMIMCECPWGFRGGAITQDDEGLSRRPCRHMLATALTGATYEPMSSVEAFKKLGES